MFYFFSMHFLTGATYTLENTVNLKFKLFSLCPQVLLEPVSGRPRRLTRLSRRCHCVPTLGSRKNPGPGPGLHPENELQRWVTPQRGQAFRTKWVLCHASVRSSFCESPSSPADGNISVSYAAGDNVCGNGVNAKTEIRLSCGSTVGHLVLIRSLSLSHTHVQQDLQTCALSVNYLKQHWFTFQFSLS